MGSGCEFSPPLPYVHLSPKNSPILLLLVAHEGADVDALSKLETSVPQDHVHSVEVEVRVRNNKAVEIIGETSHVQCRLASAKGDIAAFLCSIIVFLLIEAVEDLVRTLEEFNDFVKRLEAGVHGGRIGLGQLQEVKSRERELHQKNGLHTECHHVAKG